MRIGIDARIYGNEHAGIGRYVENLISELIKADVKNEYTIFISPKDKEKLINLEGRVKVIPLEVSHYSLKEQFVVAKTLASQDLDLVHFPHFNVPLFYPKPYVVTIHDLIKHTSFGKETTTRNPWLYWLKYLGYRIVFGRAVKRAKKIIVPSNAVKQEIINKYKLPETKISVTYEGVDAKFKNVGNKNQASDILKKYGIDKPFFVYTGSVYPHKNIEKLILAFKLLNEGEIKAKLIISCARSVFWQRLVQKINLFNARSYVSLAGFIPDGELAVVYQEAEALVFPTLMEGFGLPGLESMSVGLPVICSDIPVLREVYGEAAIYFNPHSELDIAEKLKEVLNNSKLKETLRNKGFRQAEKFSWQQTAQKTLEVYGELAKN